MLNEFDESNNNPYHGGLRLYLQNGATWRNEWLGAERVYPTQGRPNNANYLYTGSRVEHFIGGKDINSQGIIQPVDHDQLLLIIMQVIPPLITKRVLLQLHKVKAK